MENDKYETTKMANGNALNALRLIYAIVGGRYTSERLGPRPKMRSVAYRMRCVYATAEADCKIISQQHEDSALATTTTTATATSKLHTSAFMLAKKMKQQQQPAWKKKRTQL